MSSLTVDAGNEERLRRMLPDLQAPRLYFTEYPNLLRDTGGDLCAFDPLDPLRMLPGISRAEAEWAEGTATVGLNDAIGAATTRHGWRFVDGLFERSTPHGYCADDPWLVRLQETFLTQGDAFGTVHPNAAGQAAYADALTAALTHDLYVDGNLAAPRLPMAGGIPCVGDCDGDGAVTVDEIVLGVSIGLDVQAVSACMAFDTNHDDAVTIDEILQAVDAAQTGC